MMLFKIAIFCFFFGFCCYVVASASLLKWRRHVEEKEKRKKFEYARLEREADAIVNPKPAHVHDFRQVTEFIRQCRDRNCRKFQLADNAPLGLFEYLNGWDPIECRPEMLLCPDCKRSIPLVADLPQSPFDRRELKCPYCQFDLSNWKFEENNE